MGDRLEWTMNFIEEYRKHPCLWKKSSPDFRNRIKRDHAEVQLQSLLGISDVKELRAKIRSIRCTYNQEVSKIKKSKGIASCASEVYEPKLAWFSLADSFLRQNLEENGGESNLTLPENSLENREDKKYISSEEPKQEPIEVAPVINLLNFRKRPASYTPFIKKNKMFDPLDQVIDTLKQVTARPSGTVDEFTTFGQHVASQLRCLPLEEALILQEDIQKLITVTRLRCVRQEHCPR